VPEEDEDFEEEPIVANFHAVVLLSLEDYCQKIFLADFPNFRGLAHFLRFHP
jgi:hypothetical protein